MDWSRRQIVVGVLASTALCGCLGQGDDGANETPSSSQAETPQPGGEESTEQATPTATPTDAETETPTATPTDESTPAETTPTATPTDGRDSEVFPDYETTDVAVRTPGGTVLGRVRAAIADTSSLRYTGLSETESLPEQYGMLFVFDRVDDWTFVMREMDFGLDIVFADAEGAITTIHHAPEPGPDEDGEQQRYPGRGQYVLEVNKNWTTERDVETGDVLDFELP